MKEKLANSKANFDNKFEKYKNLFYILTSISLPIFVSFSYMGFYHDRAFPKPLEYLYKVNGVVISHSYSGKSRTVGTLFLKLDNGDTEHFRIFSSDDEIYKNLKGKKAVIYASEAAFFFRDPIIQQIENIEGEILMKYDYDLAIKSIGFSRGVSAFFFNVTTFLVFILSFVLYNDIKKQIISKQGVKND
ncbi:MAG: hypothetical protein PUB35_04630 [Campylobacteraceae bacterium]|nr:hypothetical protein [Campylobacteraceae bacterium]